MTRNIVLCADGTGSKGGYTPDSNVYKTYHAIDIHDNDIEQITFYDNGVGSSSNKILRAIAGAFGFGFERNVCDLYTFLSKNYNSEQDKVYLFGFSRGAATVRALNGFIYDCGLLDARNETSDRKLKAQVKNLIGAYKSRKAQLKRQGKTTSRPIPLDESVKGISLERRDIKIEFIGAWDTVAALGMPKKTDVTGPISWLIDNTLQGLDNLLNHFFHYRNYKLQLTPNVKQAFQALSIDDARTSFWPRIWNELDETIVQAKVTVEQVWFTGSHTDVGGGYNRRGITNVPLLWILEKATQAGLKLINGSLDSIRAAANAHDIMHDSRSGLGMFYRYHPREIHSLCHNEKNQKPMMEHIKIHEAVLSRMHYRTAGYAPILLPNTFQVVNNQAQPLKPIDVSSNKSWHTSTRSIQYCIELLKELYILQLLIVIAIVGYAEYLNQYCTEPAALLNGWRAWIAEGTKWLLPDFFNKAVDHWLTHSAIFFTSITVITGWIGLQITTNVRMIKHAENKRLIIRDEYQCSQTSNSLTSK